MEGRRLAPGRTGRINLGGEVKNRLLAKVPLNKALNPRLLSGAARRLTDQPLIVLGTFQVQGLYVTVQNVEQAAPGKESLCTAKPRWLNKGALNKDHNMTHNVNSSVATTCFTFMLLCRSFRETCAACALQV